MSQLSAALRTAMLNNAGVSEQLTGGKIYVFSGPVPANADTALDMVASHTQLVVISDAGGSGGLNFDTASGGVLPKQASQVWEGTVAFDGAQAASSSLPATFWRFCADTDDGRAAGGSSSYRIQGTAGGPNAAAEMDVGTDALVANGTNKVTLTVGNVRLPA